MWLWEQNFTLWLVFVLMEIHDVKPYIHTVMSHEFHGISNIWQLQEPVFQLLTIKKTAKLPFIGPLWVDPSLISGFPSQRPIMWKVFPCHDIIKSSVSLFLRQLDLLEVLMSGSDSGMIHRGCQSFSATIVLGLLLGPISKKMHLNMMSAKFQPFLPEANEWTYHSELWQVPQEQCCWDTCQISQWLELDNSWPISCGFLISQICGPFY